MKKALIVVSIVILILAAGAFGYFRFFRNRSGSGDNARMAYVENVGALAGFGLGDSSRFMGIVEAQETKKVEKDNEKKVKEIYVKIGDLVNEGDPLFIYDTEEMQMTLESKELELESLKNTIAAQYSSIEDLKKQRDSVSGDDKLGFSSQINSLTAEIKQNEYQVTVKELEIERQKDAINNAIVSSPMSGIVKTIKDDAYGNDDYNMYGNETSNAFMTIMAVGNYRVKGTASEQNIYSIMRDTPVIIRSRIDETRTWRGVVTKVDQEPANDNQQGYYYDNVGESASKYNFYVDLEDVEDLMLGQHLYIELDYGQQNERSGIYLYSYYISYNDDGSAFVWKANDKGRMEKQIVELGIYDELLDAYEIVSGLNQDDYIAFPDGSIAEGDVATTNYEDVIGQEADYGVEGDPGFDTYDESFDGPYDDMEIEMNQEEFEEIPVEELPVDGEFMEGGE